MWGLKRSGQVRSGGQRKKRSGQVNRFGVQGFRVLRFRAKGLAAPKPVRGQVR